MRKMCIVERRDHIVVVASDEEGAVDEAHAMFVESADDGLDFYKVVGSYEEMEDEDQERSELVGELKSLQDTLDWIAEYERNLSLKATIWSYHVLEQLKAGLGVRINIVIKKLAELVE